MAAIPVFLSGAPIVKNAAQKRLTRVANRVSKARREMRKPSECVVVYTNPNLQSK